MIPATIIIPGKLWLGGTPDAIDRQAIQTNGIKAVLNVRTTSLEGYEVDDCVQHWIPLLDWWGNDYEDFAQAVDTLTELQKNKVPTLVHCHLGVSRSPTVVATWFAKETGVPFDKALDIVRKMRPIVMPHPALRELARRYLGESDASSS